MTSNPMRLYHHPMSTCSHRVRLAAEHLGIELSLVAVELAQGEQRGTEFTALNPNQQVPVLVHDDLVLWESYAIMQYLADLSENDSLYPIAASARADVNRWLFWCGQVFMPGIAILNWENSIKPMIGQEPADPAAIATGEARFTGAATILDAHLATREWICETGLSLADLAIAAPLIDAPRARLPLAGLSNLERWFGQICSLTAWQAIHG